MAFTYQVPGLVPAIAQRRTDDLLGNGLCDDEYVENQFSDADS